MLITECCWIVIKNIYKLKCSSILLREEDYVTLKVYDVLGREISTLVNKEEPPGNYEVEYDASNLTSGIYFYRIQTGDFEETKKMVLMK